MQHSTKLDWPVPESATGDCPTCGGYVPQDVKTAVHELDAAIGWELTPLKCVGNAVARAQDAGIDFSDLQS